MHILADRNNWCQKDYGLARLLDRAPSVFDRILFDITDTAEGYLDFKIESVFDRIDDLDDQIEVMEARLDLKMENMITRFVAMELAMSQIQSQSSWLSGQLSAAASAWS